MASQCFIMNVNRVVTSTASTSSETKPGLPVLKEKVMSYEEKTVGSTQFFKCEACPYMALAEDDIKFHLFTSHPDLAKKNGLADNIQIPCPGCTSIFDAEETLRNHLRNHHKMGIKDVKKMVKSLVQIALKDAKLKKEEMPNEPPPEPQKPDVKIPQVIEIVPDTINANGESLPKGVAFISVDELNKMSTPNFEKVDPKEIIQEASINIVYSNEISAQFINVSNANTPSTSTNVLQVSNVTPDLISSIQPHVAAVIDKSNLSPPQVPESPTSSVPHPQQQRKPGRQLGSNSFSYESDKDLEQKLTNSCSVGNCYFRLKDNEKLAYHRKCHRNGKLQCPECSKIFLENDSLHSHLWKAHAIDMELPTCGICGFKTVKKYRLHNIHMKSHGKIKAYTCSTCQKAFKTSAQLAKHKIIHKKDTEPVQCPICQIQIANHRLKAHMAAVHEKIKPFKCSHCDYTAARKDELKLHERSHTGDKPYSCDQCIYRSADHNAMRRHKKTHSKGCLYQCKFCPYSTIQSTAYTSHVISNHPNVNASDIHKCPYCPFVTVSKDKYVVHLTTHTDKEGIQLLIEMTNKNNKNKPSWTIPSEAEKVTDKDKENKEQNKDSTDDTINTIDVEVYDCDSLNENIPQDYSTNYAVNPNSAQQTEYDNPVIQNLSREDNNSDCLMSESSNDTLMDRHQYTPQLPLQMTYDNSQTNLHGFLNTNVSMGQSLLQDNNVNSLATSQSPIVNNISNNILSNFPIRLPPAPQISRSNSNITLTPVDKISIPMTTKVTGPIILPVPSLSNSPVNISNEPEGVPRKKPKISVKSNLILKGPDQENMFHSQQKMAFKRLEDNERFGLGRPVTFNNLITTQFMQLQPEPNLSESPNNIMPYPQETMCSSSATPVSADISESSQIFSFTQQMNVRQIMLPPPQKIQTNDPSYIKLEATIKQNTQSPSLERMCNANLLSNQAINPEYKASPPLEDIHKNMSVIKNEVKSDAYYSMTLNNNAANPSIIDQYLMDNIIGEQYNGHLDLSAVVLPEDADQQNDVIEIDDNSDDNKLLPRYDMNFPLESLYLMHNDFHFLDNDIQPNNILNEVGEMNRLVSEVPNIMNQKDVDIPSEGASNDFPNFIQGKKDPVMNTSVRPTTNKINVKNIELMKN